LAQRGMPEDEARRRMAMQMTRDEYVELADDVLENDGSITDLEDQVRTLLQHELGQRGIRYNIAAEKDSEN
ncbi:dephospho-CoA kinase, partial [Patescibacteria group bacterium]|nr:dephospho-CoA kinase [Patescibacteria group bacterium]